MKAVDLTGIVAFQTQFSPKVGDVNGDGRVDRKDEYVGCCEACKIMIRNCGFRPVSASSRLDMAKYNEKFVLKKAVTFDAAKQQIDEMLNSGKPVLVGVTREKKLNRKNGNTSTGHFVLIVGRIADNKYRFYDPGTSDENLGASPKNIFELDADGFFRGISQYTPRNPYYITETRPTK